MTHIRPNPEARFETLAFIDTFAPDDVDAALALLKTTSWASGLTKDQIKAAFANSYAVGARRAGDGRLVGLARAVTDRATFAYLTDLIVAPEMRKAGLGGALIRRLLSADRVRSVQHIALLASKPSIEALAADLGFRKTDWQSAWMERLAAS